MKPANSLPLTGFTAMPTATMVMITTMRTRPLIATMAMITIMEDHDAHSHDHHHGEHVHSHDGHDHSITPSSLHHGRHRLHHWTVWIFQTR